jgi:sugar transferase EpsL
MSGKVGKGAKRRTAGLLVKRGIDILGAGVGLLLLGPVMVAAGFAIAALDGLPVLFTHERPGLGERPFRMYKFRTMRAPRPGETWLMGDGRRVTRIGRLLRSTSIDELPQFWNVLRGDMSLVGPRPLLMAHLAAYTPEERRRHDMRPGFTGWAAVNGRHTTTFEERLQLDIWYVDHWSLLLDVRIIGMTIAQVLRRADSSAVQDPALARMPERFLAAERKVSFEAPGAASREEVQP